MNFKFSLILIIATISFSQTLQAFEKEFELFYQNYTNFTLKYNDSKFAEKIDSKEKLLTIFTGLLWKNSNSSIVFSNGLKTINLFNSKESCQKELEWISKAYNLSMDIRPAFLHEINENENIRIICPQCSNKNMFFWYKINYEKKSVDLLTPNGHISFINDVMHIYRFMFPDTGTYFCSTKILEFNNHDSREIQIIRFILLFKYPSEGVYLRNVIDMNNLELVNLTRGLTDFDKLPEKSYTDNTSELVVYTLWKEWGLCGNCGGKSLRNRIGICHISYNISSNDNKNEELNEIQRVYYPHGGSCQLGIYFKYLSEDFLKMNIFDNYNQYELCDVDCGTYESILDEKAVNIFYIT